MRKYEKKCASWPNNLLPYIQLLNVYPIYQRVCAPRITELELNVLIWLDLLLIIMLLRYCIYFSIIFYSHCFPWILLTLCGQVGGQLKLLQQVASLTAERDGETRKAALNTLATCYKILGMPHPLGPSLYFSTFLGNVVPSASWCKAHLLYFVGLGWVFPLVYKLHEQHILLYVWSEPLFGSLNLDAEFLFFSSHLL